MKIIKNISTKIINPINSNLALNSNINFNIYDSTCNHIKTNGLEMFILNMKRVVNSEPIETLTNFGLNVNNDKEFIELNISYE